MRRYRRSNAETSALDAETSALDEASALDDESSAIARSYLRCRRGVHGDCGVGITPKMCNRVTNHGDMSTFWRYASGAACLTAGPQGLSHGQSMKPVLSQ